MYKNEEYRPIINIDLDKGVYIFDSESATGKTYLCKQLKKLQAYGEPVISFTYDDILRRTNLNDIDKQYEVIMLDRYDLYREEGQGLINKFKDESIILVDCKIGYIDNIDSEICYIELTDNNIEVSL